MNVEGNIAPPTYPSDLCFLTNNSKVHELTLNMQLRGQHVSALIDTGAARTFMSADLVKQLGLHTHVNVNKTIGVEVANGHRSKSLGEITMDTTIGTNAGDVTCPVTFHVFDMPRKIILGRDTLSSWKMIINLGREIPITMVVNGRIVAPVKPMNKSLSRKKQANRSRKKEKLESFLRNMTFAETLAWVNTHENAHEDLMDSDSWYTTHSHVHELRFDDEWLGGVIDIAFIEDDQGKVDATLFPDIEQKHKDRTEKDAFEQLRSDTLNRLSGTIKSQMGNILRAEAFTRTVSAPNLDLPRCRLRLRDETDRPPAARFYRMDAEKTRFLAGLLKKWESLGMIEPSSAEVAAPAMLVAKKEKGVWRLVCDFRALNARLVQDAYPLPTAEGLFERIGARSVKCFSALDLVDGYNCMALDDESSRDLTTFTTPLGNYRYKVLAQGLSVAPANFQRFMQTAFRECQDWLAIYLDDLLVYSSSEEEHVQHLTKLFELAHRYGLAFNPRKTELFTDSVKFLGHILKIRQGVVEIRAQADKLDAIRKWERPNNQKQLQSFLGLATYYHRLVKNFASIAAPLTSLAAVDFKDEDWTSRHDESFQALKEALIGDNVIISPRSGIPFVITADASKTCIGGTIEQNIHGVSRVIAYVSKKLPERAQRWPTHERELFALVHIVRKYIHLLRGEKIKYVGDHKPLLFLKSQTSISDKIARWLEFPLADIQWEFTYKPGVENVVADALSRRGEKTAEEHSSTQCDENLAELMLTAITNTSIPLADRDPILAFDLLHDDGILRNVSSNSSTESFNSWLTELLQISTNGTVFHNDSTNLTNNLSTAGVSNDFPLTAAFLEELLQSYHEDDLCRAILSGEIVPQFQLQNGVIMKTGTPGSHPVILIPHHATHLQNALLQLAHNNVLAGHGNLKQTLHKLTQFVYWEGMVERATAYVRSCDVCARVRRNTRRNVIPYRFPTPFKPFEIVGIDELILGSPTRKGNTGIWVIVDHLSRRSILVPNQGTTTSADTICRILLEHVVKNWGVPMKIVSDKGPQFISQVYHNMCEMLSITPNVSTSETPTTNGLVERTNGLILDILRKLLSTHPVDWDEYLWAVEFALNDSPRSVLGGYTPFQVSTGRTPTLPVGALISPILRRRETSLGDDKDIESFVRRSIKIISDARKSLELRAEEQLSSRMKNAPLPKVYHTGQLVWYDARAGNKTHGRNIHKLEPSRIGPYRVLSTGPQNSYYLDATPPPGSWAPPLKVLQPVNGRHLTNYEGTLPNPEEVTETGVDNREIFSNQLPEHTVVNAPEESVPPPERTSPEVPDTETVAPPMSSDIRLPIIQTRSQLKKQQEIHIQQNQYKKLAMERARIEKRAAQLQIRPAEFGRFFPPAIRATTFADLKQREWSGQDDHEIIAHRTAVVKEIMTIELLLRHGSKQEWVDVRAYLVVGRNPPVQRFDKLWGYLERMDNSLDHNDEPLDPKHILLRKCYREGLRDSAYGRANPSKSELKSRRAVVVEVQPTTDGVRYTWVNRRNDYARLLPYKPGDLDRGTRDTMIQRLQARLDDADRLELNMCREVPETNTRQHRLHSAFLRQIMLHRTLKRRLRVCELFKGQGSLGNLLRSLGLEEFVEVISIDIDEKTKPDFIVDVRKWKHWIKLYGWKPGYFDIIWASPPCTEYSAAKTVGVRDLQLADQVVRATKGFINYMQPKVFFLENPASGRFALHRRDFMHDWRHLRHEVTYCCYGAAYQKRTSIYSNLDLSNINLRHCGDRPCLSRALLGRHLRTAQRGETSEGIQGTPTKISMTVPLSLLQVLLEFAAYSIYLPSNDTRALRNRVPFLKTVFESFDGIAS